MESNPLELLYSWQAMLVAIAATGITQLVKTILDVLYGRGSSPANLVESAKAGAATRKRTLLINRFVLPMTPIVVGAVMAMVVPVRPDPVLAYVATHGITGVGKFMVYAAWGAACGQFASHLFDKIKGLLPSGTGTPGTPA
jgi:hypothetical protein